MLQNVQKVADMTVHTCEHCNDEYSSHLIVAECCEPVWVLTPHGRSQDVTPVRQRPHRVPCQCADENSTCWICGMAHIDYDAAYDDSENGDRFELGHYYPVSTHPELQHDTSDFRASARLQQRTLQRATAARPRRVQPSLDVTRTSIRSRQTS